VEDELSAGGGSVDLLREALEANLPIAELFDAGDEVFEGVLSELAPASIACTEGSCCMITRLAKC
jgi:hypothetical protein